jgi:hypothetical protein
MRRIDKAALAERTINNVAAMRLLSSVQTIRKGGKTVWTAATTC